MRLRSTSSRDLLSTETSSTKYHAVSDIIYADDNDQPHSSFSKKDPISSDCSTKNRRLGGNTWLSVSRLFSSRKKTASRTRTATEPSRSTKAYSNASSSILVNDIPIPTLLDSPTAYLIDETPDTCMDGFPTGTSEVSKPYFPVFFQHHMEEVVPWRVLEQHEEPCEGIWIDCSDDGDRPDKNSSWLELDADSSSRMTHWLSKRSESLELARDLVARRSKSIRRCWHRNHPTDSGYESDDSSSSSSSSYSGCSARPISTSNIPHVPLEAVPEEGIDQVKTF